MTDYDDFGDEAGEVRDEIAEKRKSKSFAEIINRKTLNEDELDDVMVDE